YGLQHHTAGRGVRGGAFGPSPQLGRRGPWRGTGLARAPAPDEARLKACYNEMTGQGYVMAPKRQSLGFCGHATDAKQPRRVSAGIGRAVDAARSSRRLSPAGASEQTGFGRAFGRDTQDRRTYVHTTDGLRQRRV